MKFTPYISIYPEANFDYAWFGNTAAKAILMFSKNFGYNRKLSRTRVNIHLGDESRVHTDGSIKSIWIKNTIDTSAEVSDIDKVNSVLKILFDSLSSIGKIESWDLLAIEKAYHQSIADNGNFVWHSKLKSNKNRGLKARVKILLEEDGKVPVIAEFFDNKSNFLYEVHIIDSFLHFMDWEKLFAKPVWLDNEKFGFSLINSQLLLLANATSKYSETVISEKNWSREEIEGQLRRITFRKFSSQKELVEWANK